MAAAALQSAGPSGTAGDGRDAAMLPAMRGRPRQTCFAWPDAARCARPRSCPKARGNGPEGGGTCSNPGAVPAKPGPRSSVTTDTNPLLAPCRTAERQQAARSGHARRLHRQGPSRPGGRCHRGVGAAPEDTGRTRPPGPVPRSCPEGCLHRIRPSRRLDPGCGRKRGPVRPPDARTIAVFHTSSGKASCELRRQFVPPRQEHRHGCMAIAVPGRARSCRRSPGPAARTGAARRSLPIRRTTGRGPSGRQRHGCLPGSAASRSLLALIAMGGQRSGTGPHCRPARNPGRGLCRPRNVHEASLRSGRHGRPGQRRPSLPRRRGARDGIPAAGAESDAAGSCCFID